MRLSHICILIVASLSIFVSSSYAETEEKQALGLFSPPSPSPKESPIDESPSPSDESPSPSDESPSPSDESPSPSDESPSPNENSPSPDEIVAPAPGPAPLDKSPSIGSPPPKYPIGEGPQSQFCSKYDYVRYAYVKNFGDLMDAIKQARPGDMIELADGKYHLGDHRKARNFNISYGIHARDSSGPSLANSGLIYNKHGKPGKYITICASRNAIIDGSGDHWAPAAIRVVKSSYIRVSGFTLQKVLKGIDIQRTVYSQIVNIRTRSTLQEGIRLRFHSKFNTVQGCKIEDTGLLYAGVGEGIYIGTSSSNSVDVGLPKDHSDHNTIRGNVFGPNVRAENIDAKEFTTGGKILDNVFDGRSIKGKNSAIAWVDLKGNKWVVQGNSGHGIIHNGQGFRVLHLQPGWGIGNQLSNNECNMKGGSYCIFIGENAKGTFVSCSNSNSGAKRLCNCNRRAGCGRKGRDAVFPEKPVQVYYDPAFSNMTYTENRPLGD